MMKIYDFNDCENSIRLYDGNGCFTKGIILNDEHWYLKIPRKSGRKKIRPLPEYIGSHIYEIIGIPVHQTLLGVYDGKLVVACKDICESTSSLFADFTGIKNERIDDEKIRHSIYFKGDRNIPNLDSIKKVMSANRTFNQLPELKDHFWDMYVVDSLIGNHNRRFKSWGIIIDEDKRTKHMAPAINNNCSIEVGSIKKEVEELINDRNLTGDEDCIKALLRVFPKIDLDKIKEMINDIPTSHNGLEIISEEKKQKLIECLEYKYEKGLKLIYNLHHDHQIEKEIADEIFFNEEL